mgnify:CR=1 FL=1
MNQATHKCLGKKVSLPTYGVDGWTKTLMSALVKNLSLPTKRRDGRTKKPPTSALVKNLSFPTYGVDIQTKPPMSAMVKYLSLPTYGVDGRTKPPTRALVKNLSLPMGGTDRWTKRSSKNDQLKLTILYATRMTNERSHLGDERIKSLGRQMIQRIFQRWST